MKQCWLENETGRISAGFAFDSMGLVSPNLVTIDVKRGEARTFSLRCDIDAGAPPNTFAISLRSAGVYGKDDDGHGATVSMVWFYDIPENYSTFTVE